jgi:hypothetical protein
MRPYLIQRSFNDLYENVCAYLQGIGEWSVSEGAPFLSHADAARFRYGFFDPQNSLFSDPAFDYRETEWMAAGIWKGDALPKYSHASLQR